jgi:hypothetical protein
MPNSLKLKLLSGMVAMASLLFPAMGASRETQPKSVLMWKEARSPAAKGIRVRIPKDILARLTSNAVEDSTDPCNRKESSKIDAYRVYLSSRKPAVAIVAWGRSSCYCGATGNCQFWLFVANHGEYQLVLDTGLVRDFGFLKARTNGYRDLVLWSHDSAQRSPARLLQFEGKEYREVCGWEEDYEFRELPDGTWVSAGEPKIVANDCEPKPLPTQRLP